MNAWLVVFIIAAVLSPLAWLVPSRQQKGAMQVRLQARRLGLSMQLSSQDWPHWLQRKPPAACAQYAMERRSKPACEWCYWQSEPGVWLDRWREPCADERLREVLGRLPADVYKAEAGATVVALCWGERGGAEQLQCIHDCLSGWA